MTPFRHSVFGKPASVACRPRWKQSANATPHAAASTMSATMVNAPDRPHALAVRHLKHVAAHEKMAEKRRAATANTMRAMQKREPGRKVDVLPVSSRQDVSRDGSVRLDVLTETWNSFHGTMARTAREQIAWTMCRAAERIVETPRLPMSGYWIGPGVERGGELICAEGAGGCGSDFASALAIDERNASQPMEKGRSMSRAH
jgi:hypothetical protein